MAPSPQPDGARTPIRPARPSEMARIQPLKPEQAAALDAQGLHRAVEHLARESADRLHAPFGLGW